MVLLGILIRQQVTEIMQTQFDAGNTLEEVHSTIGAEHEEAVDRRFQEFQGVTAGFGNLVDKASCLGNPGKGNSLLLQIRESDIAHLGARSFDDTTAEATVILVKHHGLSRGYSPLGLVEIHAKAFLK